MTIQRVKKLVGDKVQSENDAKTLGEVCEKSGWMEVTPGSLKIDGRAPQ